MKDENSVTPKNDVKTDELGDVETEDGGVECPVNLPDGAYTISGYTVGKASFKITISNNIAKLTKNDAILMKNYMESHDGKITVKNNSNTEVTLKFEGENLSVIDKNKINAEREKQKKALVENINTSKNKIEELNKGLSLYRGYTEYKEIIKLTAENKGLEALNKQTERLIKLKPGNEALKRSLVDRKSEIRGNKFKIKRANRRLNNIGTRSDIVKKEAEIAQLQQQLNKHETSLAVLNKKKEEVLIADNSSSKRSRYASL